MTQRLKGQETSLTFATPDGKDEDVGVVQSFEAELLLEILTEGYLGETAERVDDIYHGVTGRCEVHLETAAWFRFTQKVQDRAERRSPAGGQFNITSSFKFPGGQRARITFEDVFFGGMPIRSPDRKSYVTASLSWRCARIRRVL